MALFRRRRAEPPKVELSPYELKATTFTPDVLQTIRAGLWPGGHHGAMYRTQPAVRAVVDWLSRNIAQLNGKVYERVDDTDREELNDHPLATLLRQPNPQTSRYAHMRDTVADLAIYDRAYWQKVRLRRLFLVRIPASKMAIETQEIDGEIRTVYRSPDGRLLRRDDLVIFHGYSPEDDEFGVSPLETLRRVLREEVAAQQNREAFWRNAARQSGIIERPIEAPPWSEAGRSRFRQDWESTMAGGDNAGRTGILEEGMKWNPAAFSPKDAEYLAGRRLTYEEVAIAYGLKPSLLGLGSDTATSGETAHRHAYQDVLGPWLRMLQDEIDLQLIPEFDPLGRQSLYVEFNLAEKLKGSFEEQGRTITTAVGVPYMTPNEGRARLNLPRIDDPAFDVPIQPLNVLYGGQPAVTVPTEDRATTTNPPEGDAATASAEPRAKALSVATEAHRRALVRYFERQEASVTAALGGGTELRRSRWDDELSADLFTVGWTILGQLGVHSGQTGSHEYVARLAHATAVAINDQVLTGASQDPDGARDLYEQAKSALAEQVGAALAADLVTFASGGTGVPEIEE